MKVTSFLACSNLLKKVACCFSNCKDIREFDEVENIRGTLNGEVGECKLVSWEREGGRGLLHSMRVAPFLCMSPFEQV